MQLYLLYIADIYEEEQDFETAEVEKKNCNKKKKTVFK